MRQFVFSRQIIPNAIAQLTLLLIAGLAQADSIPGQGTWGTTLEPRDLDGNGVTDAYYDTVLDITWLADANYMNTSGWTLAGLGWPENNFVDYLAGFAHLGVNTWRLPRLDNPNQGTTGGELAHLYGVTLGNVLAPNPGATLVNTGPFINLQAVCYFYANQVAFPFDSVVPSFNMGTGTQTSSYNCARPWAVADGDVQPVQVAAPAYEIVDLGTLGGARSRAYGINNHGQIVGEAANAANVTRAFLYANGTMQDLGTLRANDSGSSVAYSINNLGQITGNAAVDTPVTDVAGMGFLHSGNAMTPIGQAPVNSTNFDYINTAKAINDNGDIAVTRHVRYPSGQYISNLVYAGVRAANGALSMINNYGIDPSLIRTIGINSAGHMIGSGPGQMGTNWFLLKDGQTVFLGSDCIDCEAYGAEEPAYAINDNNQIASTFRQWQRHPFNNYKYSKSYGEIISVQPDNSISRTPVPGSHALYLINDGGDMVGVHNGRYFVRPANGPNFYLDEITDASGWVWSSGAQFFYGSGLSFYDINDRGDLVGAMLRNGEYRAVLFRRLGPVTTVNMDVDPYSTANEILPSSDNPIPVAILSTRVSNGDAVDFDATQVDPASLKFGLGEAPNVALPWAVDEGQDGDTDMLFAFRTQDAGIFCGDTEVSLTGETYAGELIRATDTITATDCTDTGCHP